MAYEPRKYWPARFKQQGAVYVGRQGHGEDQVRDQMDVFWSHVCPLLPEGRPHVLDFGCGVGRMAPHLAPLVGRYIGVDICREALEIAPAYGNVEYAHLSEDLIPFDESSFDVATVVTVFQHIVDEAHFESWCTELAHVVKPGGRIIIIDDSYEGPTAAHVRCRKPERIAEALGGIALNKVLLSAERPSSHWCFSVELP